MIACIIGCLLQFADEPKELQVLSQFPDTITINQGTASAIRAELPKAFDQTPQVAYPSALVEITSIASPKGSERLYLSSSGQFYMMDLSGSFPRVKGVAPRTRDSAILAGQLLSHHSLKLHHPSDYFPKRENYANAIEEYLTNLLNTKEVKCRFHDDDLKQLTKQDCKELAGSIKVVTPPLCRDFFIPRTGFVFEVEGFRFIIDAEEIVVLDGRYPTYWRHDGTIFYLLMKKVAPQYWDQYADRYAARPALTAPTAAALVSETLKHIVDLKHGTIRLFCDQDFRPDVKPLTVDDPGVRPALDALQDQLTKHLPIATECNLCRNMWIEINAGDHKIVLTSLGFIGRVFTYAEPKNGIYVKLEDNKCYLALAEKIGFPMTVPTISRRSWRFAMEHGKTSKKE